MKIEPLSTLSEFKDDLESFTQKVRDLYHNSTQSRSREFLTKIASTIKSLHLRSIELQKQGAPALVEIGSILETIFQQPILLKAKRNVTIIGAADSYQPESSDCLLSFLMKAYADHPETTRSFLTELTLISGDLEMAIGEKH